MCGNYPVRFIADVLRRGSPPRVRELRCGVARAVKHAGITPACAGITAALTAGAEVIQDHPRVCGNYPVDLYGEDRLLGSPPRVRELPFHGVHPVLVAGITPACAGITLGGSQQLSGNGDHPRVCGNYLLADITKSILPGSPPRVRELRVHPA